MPKVSVIVTTYNRKEYLTETIQSILNQTYQDFILIVVDNYSDYDFFPFIESFDSVKLLPFQNQNNGIIAINRNFGINHAQSEYIAFCDDDDVWNKDKLEKQLKIFDNFDNIDICCTDRTPIDSNGNQIDKSKVFWKPKKPNLSKLLLSNYISFSSVILKRRILNLTGVFPIDIGFKAVEDYHLWIRVANFGKIYFIDEPLVQYRIHQNNATSNLSIGAKKNILLLDDLFRKFNFKLLNKVTAYAVAYSKLYYYKFRGK